MIGEHEMTLNQPEGWAQSSSKKVLTALSEDFMKYFLKNVGTFGIELSSVK